MDKYFVKYMVVYPGGASENKTRFFNTDDIEAEWQGFYNLHDHELKLLDVTLLTTS